MENTITRKIANITVVTFNRWEYTIQALESIWKNTDFLHRLVLVDNGSWDGTVEHLKNYYRDGKISDLFLIPENLGVSKGFNLGWKAVKADYYLKYDNDITVSPRWLTKICHALDLPKIGIVGVQLGPYKRRNMPTRKHRDVELDFITWNTGGIMAITHGTLMKVGFFREDLSLYALEDTEFHWRIVKHLNLEGVYVHDLEATHIPAEIDSKPDHFQMKDVDMHYRLWKDRWHDKMRKRWPKIDGAISHFKSSVTPEMIEKYRYET